MAALADDFKSRLLQCAKGLEMINAGKFGHASKRYFDFSYVGALQGIRNGCEIVLNRAANIFQRLTLRCSLRPTAWKRWTSYGVALVRFNENHGVAEAHGNSLKAGKAKVKETKLMLIGHAVYNCNRR